MSKRKIPQEKSCEITKNIKLNTTSSYNVMHEHNYFHINNKKGRWSIKNTEKIANDYDECDSIPDWCIANSSSDEEDDSNDTTNMPLSRILKIEFVKDLLHLYKNKKCANDLLPFHVEQMYWELKNTNNHDLSNIANDSNNIISENLILNDGNQYKIMQIVPSDNDATIIQNQNITNDTEFQTKLSNQPCMKLIVKDNCTHDELLLNASMNTIGRKDDKNLQNYLLSSSLHLSNSLFAKTTHSSYDNVDFAKTDTPTNNVCPPLHWIHLIYLAIKNSATENVTCYDIQRIVRCWFPYYCKKSYVKFIRIILSHINHNCQKYFHCNSFTIMIHQDDTWTINNIHINTLEDSLMKIVENNEDEIKSAMAHPDQLSTIVKGYGILHLGCSQNSIKN
ncbi:uncharacterized protein LOC100574908 isoform X2 [Acyrthosiphon pisum]|uniref:Fork-head domain-containing protein n=1 Tax=Acyrthosiphon pisum TaxID=7029 RepID=A0A8R2B2L6_ACYPI|nr:uncharacterized protein LOC100574908 isoform X2 [Acyrthosiphon pisum]|eukprot:XP_008178873.1 PREDICTED: uncharacterized protein LOC100574908 [Acyrthosiphon pisum]